jgi:hypothetical protein
LRPLLGLGRRVESDTPYTLLEYATPPAAIVDFFRNQPPYASKLEGLTPDKVLTREVLEEARQASLKPEA